MFQHPTKEIQEYINHPRGGKGNKYKFLEFIEERLWNEVIHPRTIAQAATYVGNWMLGHRMSRKNVRLENLVKERAREEFARGETGYAKARTAVEKVKESNGRMTYKEARQLGSGLYRLAVKVAKVR